MQKLWTLLIISSWVFLYAVSQDFVGRFEGYLFPVVDQFQITTSETRLHSTLFNGFFHKNRECDFRSIESYAVSEQMTASVNVDFLDKERVRTEGLQYYGPWKVDIRPNEVYNMKIYVRHECHPFYDTITRLQ